MSTKDNQPQIKVFVSAILILVLMWVATGILTHVIPSGTLEGGTLQGAYVPSNENGISFFKWLGAPILVLFSDSGGLVIAITLFLLVIGGAIYVLKESGLIEGVIIKITQRFLDNEMKLMAILIFFFMALGAFIGVFEEVVPLAPLVLLLSRRMGWDDLTGLGITLLACGVGFSAAVTNPFTIGVAQELAGIPIFSGALYRFFIFLVTYLILFFYLYTYTQKHKVAVEKVEMTVQVEPPQRAYRFFISIMLIMFAYIVLSPFISILRDFSLVMIGLSFLVASLGVGYFVFGNMTKVGRSFIKGAIDMSPAILLILLATSIKYVMMEGQILDTILYQSAQLIEGISPIMAIIGVFVLVMILNFFIGSGSAKAFILMPIMMPIMDLMGMGRQLGILAFQFGDGFSNILYPTNAVLLISLGLTQVSYGKWFKFVLPLQIILLTVSMGWLGLGYLIGYGL